MRKPVFLYLMTLVGISIFTWRSHLAQIHLIYLRKWWLNVIYKPKVWYLNFLSSFFHMKIFKTRENICTRSQCSFPGFQLDHTYFKIVEKVIFFSKIRNFRQRLLTTCWTYGIFDIGAVEGPIWSPFSPNFMVPHLILAQGPKKNQFFVPQV